jgi:hypothetical protein
MNFLNEEMFELVLKKFQNIKVLIIDDQYFEINYKILFAFKGNCFRYQ